jgi:hypothetical protein
MRTFSVLLLTLVLATGHFAARGSGGFQNAVDTPVAAAEEPAPPAWVKPVEDAVGRKGTFKGSVLSFGVPRSDTITMAGMTIPPAAGVGEAINLRQQIPATLPRPGTSCSPRTR